MIVADSSSIISLTSTCMSPILRAMKAEIVVTKKVYDEIITRPAKTKRYALESLKIRKLFLDGVLAIRNPQSGLLNDIMDKANSIYRVGKQPLKIIHLGEAEVMALLSELEADAFLVDERTTRLLVEDPEGLRELLSRKNNRGVDMDRRVLSELQEILPTETIIRSTELAAIAYEKGLFRDMLGIDGVKQEKVLEAILCSLKFSGCSISWNEINKYRRLVKAGA